MCQQFVSCSNQIVPCISSLIFVLSSSFRISKPSRSYVFSIFLVVDLALVKLSKIHCTWYHCFIVPPSSPNGFDTTFPILVDDFSICCLHVLHLMRRSMRKFNIPQPGIPRAFDPLPCPGRREFDSKGRAWVGNLTVAWEGWGI